MKYCKGLTLIELMVTLTIMAIVLTTAVPSLQDFIVKNRVGGIATDFLGTLNYARSEAIKRSAPVSICKSSNGSACTGNWQDGWIVFSDKDGDGALDSGDDSLLRVGEAIGTNFSAATDNFASAVTYSRSGMASNTGIFVFCHNGNVNQARGVAITLTRPRFATDTDSDGIPNKENSSGTLTEITSCEAP